MTSHVCYDVDFFPGPCQSDDECGEGETCQEKSSGSVEKECQSSSASGGEY